jgi:integrase
MTDLITLDSYSRVVRLVTDSLASPHSRRAYDGALRRYLAWHQAGDWPRFSRASVQAYRAYLIGENAGRAGINQAISALHSLAREAAAQGILADEVAAGILMVKGAGSAGRRTGNWLTKKQAQQLLDAPDPSTLAGKRDRLILGLLLGCGLRREEAVRLQVEQIQERDSRPVIVDLVGKGGRLRTVPMPRWCRALAGDWLAAAGITTGPILRAIHRGDGASSAPLGVGSLYLRVLMHARTLGLNRLAPHDLRRSFARLALDGGAKLDQIQVSLGHANMVVTQRYLGTALDLKDPACDHLGLGGSE